MREKRILKNLTIALVIVGLAVMLLPSMATATTSCINCSNGVSTKANTIYGTPVPLSQDSKLTASGYAAADVGMRNLGYGTININLPAGSTIQKAYLYWSVINNSESPSLATGTINSKPITGTLIATTGNPCWTGQIYNFKADVTGLAANGANALSDFASGSDGQIPLLEGASLVVVYDNPDMPPQTVLIYDGGITFGNHLVSTTITNFGPTTSTKAATTYIVADGQHTGYVGMDNKVYIGDTLLADHTLNGSGPGSEYWDTLPFDVNVPVGSISANLSIQSGADSGFWDCITWVAQVFSVPSPNQPPDLPSELNQFKSDGFTAIEVNNKTMERTVVFKATVKDNDSDQVKLQIELRRTDENGGNFNENLPGLKNSSFVSSGSEASIIVNDLIDGNYHWRARAIDKYENVGPWQDFGNNSILNADFIVSQNNHWVAVIPVQLGALNKIDYQSIVKRSDDLAAYYKQQSYGKENMKVDILLNGNYLYTNDNYQTYLANSNNNVYVARQQIVSDATNFTEDNQHINLTPYDAVIVIAAGNTAAIVDGKNADLGPVGCSVKSRYLDINGCGSDYKKSWAIIPENRLSSVWVHETGHAVFDFMDKYVCGDGSNNCMSAAGGNIWFWGIMGAASGSSTDLLGNNPISPMDPISKRDAGWISETKIDYGMHQPINLIGDKGIYFFKSGDGNHRYIIEGRAPPDSITYDSWCSKTAKKCGGAIVNPNPLKKTKGILIYEYRKDDSVTVPDTGKVYAIDRIFNIPNPAAGKDAQDTVTLEPKSPDKSTIEISGTIFHVTEDKKTGQLYLDISRIIA